MNITDYGNSYIVWTSYLIPDDDRVPGHMPYENTVRILLDSICWLTNEETAETTEYRLISPCRTEWMYRDDVLWQQPNFEFSGIHSDQESMAGHVRAGDLNKYGGDWRRVVSTENIYRRKEFVIRHYPKARELKNDAETVEATMAYVPIVARTEVWSEDRKMRATIEYPIRTMNLALDQGRMQVDTGPVIFPDFETPVEREIQRLHFAFVCYNRDDVAEFVLRGKVPGGHHVDYHDVRRVEMKNRFYAAEE